MPLIENARSNAGFGYGSFTPHADMNKHGVVWAAVEGNNDGRWPTVRDCQDGLNVGNDGKKKIAYTEFKNGGKTHDITRNGVTLREMICPIGDVQEKDAYEAKLSTMQVENFLADEDRKARERGSSTELVIEENLKLT